MPFQKGRAKTGGRVAGTPNKAPEELKQKFRDMTPLVAKRLVELLLSDEPMVALKAGEMIMDRGWGKPATTQILEGGENPIKQETTINGKDAREELIRRVDKMAENLASPTNLARIEPDEKAIH